MLNSDTSVLIVDDAEHTRTMTISMLHSINIRIITEADNGQSALDMLRTNEIDLILLDVIMPGMTGIEVLKKIRADPVLSSKKVILVTAAADAKTILLARAHSTRADGIIVKPFSVTTLRDKIIHVLKGSDAGARDTVQLKSAVPNG